MWPPGPQVFDRLRKTSMDDVIHNNLISNSIDKYLTLNERKGPHQNQWADKLTATILFLPLDLVQVTWSLCTRVTFLIFLACVSFVECNKSKSSAQDISPLLLILPTYTFLVDSFHQKLYCFVEVVVKRMSFNLIILREEEDNEYFK